MSPARAPARPHRAPKGEGDRLRVEILDAAERLLVQHGSEDAVSIREIAESVGVTPPSIYRHFADKEELFYAVCDRRFAEFNDALDAAVFPDDPVEALRALGLEYVRFALEHREQYRVLMMTARDTELTRPDSEGGRAFGRLVEAVQLCIDRDLCRSDDALSTAVALWAGVHGLSSLLITARGFPWPAPPEELARVLIDIQMRGVLA